MENKELMEKIEASSQAVEKLQVEASAVQNEQSKEEETQNTGHDGNFHNEQDDASDKMNEVTDVKSVTHEGLRNKVTGESELAQMIDESRDLQSGPQQEVSETSSIQKVHDESNSKGSETEVNSVGRRYSGDQEDAGGDFEPKSQEKKLDDYPAGNILVKEKDYSGDTESTQTNQKADEIPNEDLNLEPVFDGTEVPGMEGLRSTSVHKLDADQETSRVVDKAVALKNFVKGKSAVVVSTMLRRLSGKSNEGDASNFDDEGNVPDFLKESESTAVAEKAAQKFAWNPLNYIKKSADINVENKTERGDSITDSPQPPIDMKGRIILYTKLGCQESKEIRLFLHMKRLRYVEINIDVYPSRKMELEKFSGSTSVPKVYFNEILVGGLSELKNLEESGDLDEKIDFLITEAPLFEAPSPPLSGEDDVSSSGVPDEMATIVCKMKESIAVKDRFYKMRRFTNCFLGSEAVDFLSEDQYLERQEAVEFARKLASKLFFHHVLDENIFEDGNHLYRFLDDDPIVASQCHNIPKGIITVKPKPVVEIASRLRFLSYAMFEAYAFEDGHRVDYTSLHGSEEFARYLRTVEELQRVEVWGLSREEKLAFFINLYNMMTIHAILVLGHPAGAMERRKLFGEFKYLIGGSTYSLSAIQNGILRGNQRPPYNVKKPFGAKDKRLRAALPYPEPLIHFALVHGTRSGPVLRCYSPGNIDEELTDAVRNFLRNGGVVIDLTSKAAHASKILKWYSIDFGKSEVEVLKHVSNYLDPADSEILLDLLATSDLKVTYHLYDWGLNG